MSNQWSDDKKEQYADIMRKLFEHENTLLNMRFSWFTTIQGLLFASLGFLWKERTLAIIVVVCIMGIVVAISVLSAVRLWRVAVNNLHTWWEKNLDGYDGPPVVGIKLPKKMSPIRYFRPWRILPWAFMLAWVFILIYSIVTLKWDAPITQ